MNAKTICLRCGKRHGPLQDCLDCFRKLDGTRDKTGVFLYSLSGMYCAGTIAAIVLIIMQITEHFHQR